MHDFTRRNVRQQTTYKGTLDIGNSLRLPVWMFPKTMEAKLETLKTVRVAFPTIVHREILIFGVRGFGFGYLYINSSPAKSFTMSGNVFVRHRMMSTSKLNFKTLYRPTSAPSLTSRAKVRIRGRGRERGRKGKTRQRSTSMW